MWGSHVSLDRFKNTRWSDFQHGSAQWYMRFVGVTAERFAMSAVCLSRLLASEGPVTAFLDLSPRVHSTAQNTVPATAVVWLADSSEAIAAMVSERLRDLNVSVRLGPPPSLFSSPSAQVGTVVLNRFSSIEEITQAAVAGEHSADQAWRGGLAPGALRRVKEHVEALLFDRIEVGDLARLVALSECHFSRAFRQSMGVPPHRYILGRRIEAAARLIADSDRALSEIAVTVGFSDQSHFTRTFLRFTGETPSAFRHRNR